MSAVWWSSPDAEHPDLLDLKREHVATRGDHFGTVQTGCPLCIEARAADPAPGQLTIEAADDEC